MLSRRKRARPNPPDANSSAATSSSPHPPAPGKSNASNRPKPVSRAASSLQRSISGHSAPTTAVTTSPMSPNSGPEGSTVKPQNGTSAAAKEMKHPRSWYGSWPRKSTASIQVNRDAAVGGTIKAKTPSDLSRYDRKNSMMTLGDSDSQSIRAMSITGADGVTLSTSKQAGENGSGDKQAKTQGEERGDTEMNLDGDVGRKKDAEDGSVVEVSRSEATAPTATASYGGWLGGWWGRQPVQQKQETGGKESEPGSQIQAEALSKHQSTPEEGTAKKKDANETGEPPEPSNQSIKSTELAPTETSNEASEPQPSTPKTIQSRNSWFGLLSAYTYGTPSSAQKTEDETKQDSKIATEENTKAKDGEDTVLTDAAEPAPSDPSTSITRPATNQPATGSTWAFWSRESTSKSAGKSTSAPEQGELAVMGEGSEAHPKQTTNVSMNEPVALPRESSLKKGAKGSNSKAETTPNITNNSNKKARLPTLDLDESIPPRPNTPTSTKSISSKTATSANLLLPLFKNTYRMKQNPSIINQLTQLLLRIQQPPVAHVDLVKDPPKIKRAIAIGVHGLFPASYLRPIIGQPTGTSIRFANHGAEAIRRWVEAHGCEDCEIEKVALEGEGKIMERVDNLWKLLLNWIDHIRRADLIVVACHSQGVPVGIMLVAKLIELGVVTGSRIGICAMAGVSLGPFPDYKSGMGMLMGSGAELWQFSDPLSDLSQRYEQSLKTALSYGARVTYIGSIDDQLVPMESAVYSPACHPYIYRAAFIDGRIHAPDFIAHLVGFALKLRNLGISDQGLIRELSIALAGSLYSGEGHSRLYDDECVYDLAISHALETTIVRNVPCTVQKYEGLASTNPYVLPWIMRGLLEEDIVKTELSAETAELLRQFDDWKPTTKALRDIKFRLEAVRSKL